MAKWYLDTEHPVAVNSPDHLAPHGTAVDNSINLEFNKKIIDLFNGNVSVLDLGCAGGGFIRTLVEAGQIAVGLEGSDYSLKIQRAEWGVIPDNLFTCDITKPFTLHWGDHVPYQFDIVTAWEVLEHIAEPDLPQVMSNIHRHLKVGGLFFATTSRSSCFRGGVELHQTVQGMRWWSRMIKATGFCERPSIYKSFEPSEWIRPKSRCKYVFQRLEHE